MSQVTLRYPITGDPTLSVELPYPKLSVEIDVEPNQQEHRAAAGNLWTAKIGPTIYKIKRGWEALSESEVAELFAFLEGIGFAYNRFLYCYVDSEDGLERAVPCRLVEPPDEEVVHVENRDVMLTTEQYVHHDPASEPTLEPEGAIVDEDDDLIIDEDGNVIVDETGG